METLDVIADAGNLSLGALKAQLDGGAEPSATAPPAALSIRRLADCRIRASSMPLRPGHRLRLVLSGDDNLAACLLVFDAESIDEDMAVAFLAGFKDDMEMPLRLLA